MYNIHVRIFTVMSILHFDERVNRLFITFNYQLTVMEMKAELKGRVTTYDKPVAAAIYNNTYNQVRDVHNIIIRSNNDMTVWI